MDLVEGGLANPIDHWYFSHKFKWLRKSLDKHLQSSRHLIDIGAGSAIFSLELLKLYPNLNCSAIDINYSDQHKALSKSRLNYTRELDVFSGNILLFTDVLEHVENPAEMLKFYLDRSADDAKILITVPAHEFLWSGHDVYLQHFKRYSRKDLVSLVSSVGLQIIDIRHLYVPLFPIAFLLRKLPSSRQVSSQLRDYSPSFNRLLKGVLGLDRFLSSFIPFGISLMVLAEKNRE